MPKATVTFRDRLNSGYFDMSDVAFPTPEPYPAILRDKVAPEEITMEMVKKIQDVRERYEQSQIDFANAVDAYRAESVKRQKQFCSELMNEYHTGHLSAETHNLIYNKACENDDGFASIASRYEEIALFVKECMQAEEDTDDDE